MQIFLGVTLTLLKRLFDITPKGNVIDVIRVRDLGPINDALSTSQLPSEFNRVIRTIHATMRAIELKY